MYNCEHPVLVQPEGRKLQCVLVPTHWVVRLYMRNNNNDKEITDVATEDDENVENARLVFGQSSYFSDDQI